MTIETTTDLLSAQDILDADDLTTKEVLVEEWKGTVLLKALSAADAIKFVESSSTPAQKKKANVRIVQLCAIDAEGERLFTTKQLEALQQKSLKALNSLALEALKLNGLAPDKDEEDELGED